MEPLRAVVFIDGNNFRNNLQAFKFYSSDRNSPWHRRGYFLDEKCFNWKKFFQDMLVKYREETGYDYRLVRVYWYNAATIRPFEPVPAIVDKALAMCQKEFSWITKPVLFQQAQSWYLKEKKLFDATKEKAHREIQSEYNFIQFKYVGEYVVKPFEAYFFDYQIDSDGDGIFIYQGVEEGEKGVDVGISVDMISKMVNYDVAILITGDADFIPAVNHLRENLKYVYQFSIAQGIPPNVRYLSPFLKDVIDVYQRYDELELLGKYLKRQTVPASVLIDIDKRIRQLQSLMPRPHPASLPIPIVPPVQ